MTARVAVRLGRQQKDRALRPVLRTSRGECASLLEFDRFVRAHIRTGATLGAVVRTRENRRVLEVERTRGALVYADAARGTQIGIDNRLAHDANPFHMTGVPPPLTGRCRT